MLRQKRSDEGRSKKSDEAVLHCAEDGAAGEGGSVSAVDWWDRVRSRADCRQRVAGVASLGAYRYDASARDDGSKIYMAVLRFEPGAGRFSMSLKDLKKSKIDHKWCDFSFAWRVTFTSGKIHAWRIKFAVATNVPPMRDLVRAAPESNLRLNLSN
jgi:hypothetical protein